MNLQPLDFVVSLSATSLPTGWTFAQLADVLGISVSAAHRSVKAAMHAGLLHPTERRPIANSVLEFAEHGLRYAFPPELGKQTRGMATAMSAPALAAELSAANSIVWPFAKGSARGEGLKPLHPCMLTGAEQSPMLYALFALAETFRVGSARERGAASSLLKKQLKEST